MPITPEDKKHISAVSISTLADIILSHNTNSTQSECAVSGLKTILKNIMPYLRDDKNSEQIVTNAFKGLEHLKETAESSFMAPFVNAFGAFLNLNNENLLVTVLPSVCGAFISKLTEKDPLFERFNTLAQVLGTAQFIETTSAQLNFINEILDINVPDFIGDDNCKALTVNLAKSCDLDYDTIEKLVYGVFCKVKACEIQNPDFVPTGEVFVDDPEYIAKRERGIFVKGLQKYTLETLVLTKQFLEEHGLRFYLTEGTMLGAVRHNGFIPWDDDVDIAMPRKDYDKLVELARQGKIPPQLNFDALENNPKHWVLGAKMQLRRTTPYIQHKVTALSACNGPYVDIFPLDYWDKPAGIKAWKTGMNMHILRRLIFIKTGYSKITKIKIERMVALVLVKFIKHGFLQKLAVKTLKKGFGGTRDYMVNLCSYYPYYKEVFPAGFFGEPVYIDFEGYKMPVPSEYDYMLKTVYGKNYDTIPPAKVTTMRKHTFDLREDINE